ncbi:hypothetical protein [Bremerella volcania]|uniref:hypothetical protein n=1 Tax=Bremerella volcania TaxID=2527984 RepID=UPI0011A82DAE|nr:hypothetical protein [Bremerella volcania]
MLLVFAGFTIVPWLFSLIGLGIPVRYLLIPFWCYILVSTVVVFRLSQLVYSTSIAILCGLLMLTVILGLPVLAIVNQKAVRVLKRQGLKPGPMGMSQSEARIQLRSLRKRDES